MSSSPDGNASILYFEGSSFVGKRESYCCGYAKADGSRHSAYWPNIAFFCPHCGEIWGRAVYDFSFEYSPLVSSTWTIESRRCPSHGDGYFLSGLGEESLPFCSLGLLKREAHLLCLNNPEFK